ncbi:acyl-CoA dehydrogenase family protein [Quatrionicoccus australiensis]|uniref:acyl-CoA dehydrogenase family protein n=1 Tax=Quatrionicoccus australiensis TaxID=138118 RepID=UPI001CF97A61|nr:acyl-CoA dehydrogenase family protein [Quatrionicoccus australiensis]MCB4358789.1 acyl-CoA/acyl-ACP dehydrogenase [Quatrionicoccus australiensis]
MSTVAEPVTLDLETLIARDLAPRVTAIDLEGEYPEAFLRAAGQIGAFAGVVGTEYGGSGKGLGDTIAQMAKIGETCLSTAFTHWCQTACARYIQLSDNAVAKAEFLPALAAGRQLGGTGLSNTFKSCCEIERFLLTARRVEGGYEINGTLPWVSNLGDDHVFVTGCPVDGDGRLLFFIVKCNQAGFKLVDGAHFTALEGTRTLACQFRNVRIDDSRVLAHPEHAATYLQRIQPGMILAQLGMGLGLIRDCIALIERAGRTHQHINCFEDDQVEELQAALSGAEAETFRLAAQLDAGPAPETLPGLLTEVLRLRLAGGELSLRAANAAMLHQGARGYLRTAAPQRRLREAYFVAIVTPSLKHLRREIARREGKL